nr:hypothetical protein Itr_chr11CG01810 [Ipomoea trifida]
MPNGSAETWFPAPAPAEKSGRVGWAAEMVFQSKLMGPSSCRSTCSSCFRLFIAGSTKDWSLSSGNATSISSNCDEVDDGEPWLCSLVGTPPEMAFSALECFL